MILFAIILAAILVAFAIKAVAKQAYRWDNAGWTPGKGRVSQVDAMELRKRILASWGRTS